MCGIAGLFDLRDTRPPPPGWLAAMTRALRHRGPDGAGEYHAPGVALGHRRLAIIDLAAGHQPMANEDDSIWVVFNGEIYNHNPLRQELQSLGHVFRTRSDTEVILHAWESWGAGCLTRFRGMFALALWDDKRRELFLARDPIGIKPLYYTARADGWLAVASEVTALTTLPETNITLSPPAIDLYLTLGYIPDPWSVHPGMMKLPPGCCLILKQGAGNVPEPTTYWDIQPNAITLPATLDEAAEELKTRLRTSVAAHLIADVPVGLFLSGGVDSSAVAWAASRESREPLQACTVSFAEKDHDETNYATTMARSLGLPHDLVRASPERFDLLPALARIGGEPLADSSLLPTWLVCQLARQRVKVVLSGDGGDETMAGYDRFPLLLAEERIRRLLPSKVRQMLLGGLARIYPRSPNLPRPLRLGKTLDALTMDAPTAWLHGLALLPEAERLRLYSPAARRALQGFRGGDLIAAHWRAAPFDHPLTRLQYLEMKTFLAGRVLVKVDRASMAHGLEVRVPLLDHELVTWLFNLPPAFKLAHGQGKRLLKHALAPHLPEELLHRPKQGFAPPLAAWTRGPLRPRLLNLPTGPLAGLLEPAAVEELVTDHLAGRRERGAALWALLILEGFLLGGEGADGA